MIPAKSVPFHLVLFHCHKRSDGFARIPHPHPATRNAVSSARSQYVRFIQLVHCHGHDRHRNLGSFRLPSLGHVSHVFGADESCTPRGTLPTARGFPCRCHRRPYPSRDYCNLTREPGTVCLCHRARHCSFRWNGRDGDRGRCDSFVRLAACRAQATPLVNLCQSRVRVWRRVIATNTDERFLPLNCHPKRGVGRCNYHTYPSRSRSLCKDFPDGSLICHSFVGPALGTRYIPELWWGSRDPFVSFTSGKSINVRLSLLPISPLPQKTR